MTNPKIRQAWQALSQHAEQQKLCHLRTLFEGDDCRFEDFSLQQPGIIVDFSKQRISRETLDRLHDLAEACDIPQWQEKMLAGEAINHTENRAALHMALRVPANTGINIPRQGTSVVPEVHQNLEQLQAFCSAIHEKSWRGYSNEYITDVVNLGIGGSDLGPRMVVQALAAYQQPDLKVHFVSNMDGADLAPLLAQLNPRTTLFIVVSKTFGTEETLTNAHTARNWLLAN
ncbi:MAG: glucose-6-phosphate isomerase, partial [Azovibrio sp.]